MAARLPIAPPSAVALTLNSDGDAAGEGAINSASEVDFFTFQAPVAGRYVIDIRTPDSNLDTTLTARVGALSRRNDNLSANNTDSRLVIKAKANATIVFAVSKSFRSEMLGAYSWSVNGPSAPQIPVPPAPALLISPPPPAPVPVPTPAPTPTPEPSAVSLNQKVLDYAAASIGQKVGDGQCTALVQQALTGSGARGITIQNGKYAWGALTKTLTPGQSSGSGIEAGDVLQFYSVRFEGPWRTGGWYSVRAVQHTVIVKSVNGDQIETYEQNSNQVQAVTQGWYDLSHLKEGTVYAYRPVKAG